MELECVGYLMRCSCGKEAGVRISEWFPDSALAFVEAQRLVGVHLFSVENPSSHLCKILPVERPVGEGSAAASRRL